ncbi:peptidase inhibitor family I36 protein [Catellatospora vulcania]|uniref:peptidase inhibitor family I36 protein n=1 Tax=Catellatospora vulcania TaxID=1460450 RepID=UPI0012D3F7D0|nr:peptidase inhibitor family I36 protein [Catellatospora vulcania]
MRSLRAAMITLTAAATLTVPAPAQAASGGPTGETFGVTTVVAPAASWSCPAGYFCIWRYTNPGSNTNRYSWYGNDGDYRNNHWDDGATVDNTPSAAWNASNQSNVVRFWPGVNYSFTSAHDFFLCLNPGQKIPDLRDFGLDFDNTGSSHMFVDQCAY